LDFSNADIFFSSAPITISLVSLTIRVSNESICFSASLIFYWMDDLASLNFAALASHAAWNIALAKANRLGLGLIVLTTW